MKKDEIPFRLDPAKLGEVDLSHIEGEDEKAVLLQWAERVAAGAPFIEPQKGYREFDVQNVSISRCFNCDKIAVWIFNRLAYPIVSSAPLANTDLPDYVRLDYEEAGTILQLSPRGAAALLRLAIQKLCKELGGKGKNIDADIACSLATVLILASSRRWTS
jgi:hypothetical protein